MKYICFLILVVLIVFIALLIHGILCPNTNEYKIFIVTNLAVLIFIASSYYTIRTTDKQNMYNAYLQARMSIWSANNAARWFRNGNTWGMHHTKDCLCFCFMFLSCSSMYITFIFSIFLESWWWCFFFFVAASIFFLYVIYIRLGFFSFNWISSIYKKTKNDEQSNADTSFIKLLRWVLDNSYLTLWMQERDKLGKDVGYGYSGWFKDNYDDKREFFADPEPKFPQLFPICISKETKENLKKLKQKSESCEDVIQRLLQRK